jgi:hypothetical protein
MASGLWPRLQSRARRSFTEARHFRVRLHAWLLFEQHLRQYRILTESDLRATRKSDKVFIFGSGASLNDVPPDHWREMSAHDTIGFNWFVHQRFVRCDYHFVRETGADDLDARSWRPRLEEYCDLARRNPHYAATTFLVQSGFRATNGNRAIGLRLLPDRRPIFLFRSVRGRREPTRRFSDGLPHNYATLEECVNFAYLMGWTEIVLVGVDLYDRRYFWLPPDVPVAGSDSTEGPHLTARTGLIDLLGEWRERFARENVQLFVYNERSLLARSVPVWPQARSVRQ